MRSNSFGGMVCLIAGVLDAVGDRWAMLILRDLGLGPCHYDDLRKSTGVTHATLSDRLKGLEASGLSERRLYQTGPDRDAYVLTRRGAEIILVIQALARIGDNMADRRPPLRFINRNSGRAVKVAVVDEKSGDIVRSFVCGTSVQGPVAVPTISFAGG